MTNQIFGSVFWFLFFCFATLFVLPVWRIVFTMLYAMTAILGGAQ